jgi:uncharacterized protein
MSNEVNYFEIGSPDAQGSKAFYSGLFGWEIDEPTGPAPYWMVDRARGGLWDTTELGGQTWAIFYVQVADVADTVAAAEAMGATVAVGLTDNGNIQFAHLVDPQGNRFGVWTPKSDS